MPHIIGMTRTCLPFTPPLRMTRTCLPFTPPLRMTRASPSPLPSGDPRHRPPKGGEAGGQVPAQGHLSAHCGSGDRSSVREVSERGHQGAVLLSAWAATMPLPRPCYRDAACDDVTSLLVLPAAQTLQPGAERDGASPLQVRECTGGDGLHTPTCCSLSQFVLASPLQVFSLLHSGGRE